ncbi:MAG: hypothetical protein QM756_09255 [Polyangiaceae bacterium]
MTPSRTLLTAACAGLLISTACGSNADEQPAAAKITASTLVPGLTEAAFTEMCAERGGVVEVIAHCGGLNTCRGFSYDSTTELLSEHTCKGAATCGGWNCLLSS